MPPPGSLPANIDVAASLSQAATLLRERRFRECEVVLNGAMAWVVEQQARVLASLGWTAQVEGDYETALARWESLRQVAPNNPAGYSAATQALLRLRRYKEAETMAQAGLRRFPNDASLLTNHAWAAQEGNDWPAAIERWTKLRLVQPDFHAGYEGGARALRQLDRPDEAANLLDEGLARLGSNRELLGSRAALASHIKDWSGAYTLWRKARENHPDFALAYLREGQALMRLGRPDEAETMLQAAAQRFPEDALLVAETARCAAAMARWEEAARRWQSAQRMAPDMTWIAVGLAEALSRTGRLEHADEMLGAYAEKFPEDVATAIAYARVAGDRARWSEALGRWKAAYSACSHSRAFMAAMNEAAMRALLADEQAIAGALNELTRAAAPSVASQGESAQKGVEIGSRDLLMQFESLGYNCEFGIVQRHFGAEPLGLLRWTATDPDQLAEALNRELDGVGLPENTRIILDGDYRTMDTRYFMLMHTFIPPDQATPEELLPKFCKRLQYLRGKLLKDLRAAEKIFVYKAVIPITDEQIIPLWHAIRTYGPNTLMVTRIADDRYPPGTMREIERGLMVGYFDRTSTTDPSFDIWLALCRQAYAIWLAAGKEARAA